jgi:hypothetical protein
MRIKFTGNKEQVEQANRYLEIYLGDYTPEQQYAASILLHMLLKDDGYRELMELLKEVTGFRVNDRNSGRVVAWKKKVKKGGKCEVCGATKNLEAHHKIPWSCSIKGRTDVKNGQCLCRSCHDMMHDDYLWVEYMRRRGEQSGN